MLTRKLPNHLRWSPQGYDIVSAREVHCQTQKYLVSTWAQQRELKYLSAAVMQSVTGPVWSEAGENQNS